MTLSGVRPRVQRPVWARSVFVVAQVAFEVAAQSGLLRDQMALESRLPALLEDRALHPLDAAIGLRPGGLDEALARTEFRDRLAEDAC